jgi:hypothetical protein
MMCCCCCCVLLLLLLFVVGGGGAELSRLPSLISLYGSAGAYAFFSCCICAEDEDQDCDGTCPEATRLQDALTFSEKKVLQLGRDLAASKQKKSSGSSPSHQKGLATKATNRAVRAEGRVTALEDKLADEVIFNHCSHQHRCCVVRNHTAKMCAIMAHAPVTARSHQHSIIDVIIVESSTQSP